MAVFKRGEFFHFQFMIDGVRYRGSTKQKTLGKARQWEMVRMTDIRDGKTSFQKKPLLSEFSGPFLDHISKRVEANDLDSDTQKTYRAGWRLLSSTDVAGMRLDQIGTADAAELRFPGSASNANTALRTLSRMLSHACEKGILKASPKIHLRKEHGRETIIDHWLEELILELAPKFLADMAIIMFDCGMRPEEVRRMRWENIFWDRGLILVPYGKSDLSRRHVGITDRMQSCLRVIQNDRKSKDSPWVFPASSESGHRTSTATIFRKIIARAKTAARKRGLPALPDGLVLYSARHTFATNFLKAGGHVSQLQKLLGHASLTTTMKYVHMVADGSAEIMNKHNRNRLHVVKSA